MTHNAFQTAIAALDNLPQSLRDRAIAMMEKLEMRKSTRLVRALARLHDDLVTLDQKYEKEMSAMEIAIYDVEKRLAAFHRERAEEKDSLFSPLP
jgi:hypothetical protein